MNKLPRAMGDVPIRRSHAPRLGAIAAAFALATLAFATGPVRADYQGPDENTGQAYGPLKGDTTYSATLNQDNSNPGDQDWYYFYVPAAGDHLHWAVSNTNALSACPPYQCNVYATLEGSNGQQLGGADSSAGTSGAAPGITQTIDWTFQAPGKYYIALVGDGPRISYQFSVTPASGVSAAPPGGGATGSLGLTTHQHGRSVEIGFVAPSAGARLDAWLYMTTGRSGRLAGRLQLSGVPKARDTYAIALDGSAWTTLKQRHRLKLSLRIKLTPRSGTAVRASKNVVVTYPR